MSLTENTGNMVMPVGPMGGYGGFGDSLFWIIVLFLFAFMGNGFGNGFSNGGMMPFMMNQNTGADVQRGHSIEDRMIATLEQQMDNANSSYERQMIQEEINHIRMRNR